MAKKFTPATEMTISDLETLKVMSDPLRMNLLEAFMRGPTTVKQIAAQVNVPQSKLYYHVGMLEKHGLIAVVDTQLVSGIVEKWYQAAASSFRIDRKLLKGAEAGSAFDLIQTVFDASVSEIKQSIQEGLVSVDDEDPNPNRLVLNKSITYLTPEQVETIRQRIDELAKDFDDCQPKDGASLEGRQPFTLLIGLYPRKASFDESPEDQE